MSNVIKEYPQYFKQGLKNRFLKLLNETSFILVQVVGYDDGTFVHLHSKHNSKSEEYMQIYLEDYKPCTKKEYEAMMEAFFQVVHIDAQSYKNYLKSMGRREAIKNPNSYR